MRGSIVLLHEIWGLTAEIERIAERLAAEGFEVLCPDLYDGRIPTDGREARALALRFDGDAAIDRSITTAVTATSSRPTLLGFSMGGALAIAATARLDVRAAITFYGLPPSDRIGDVRAPILGHFADRDPWCHPDRVDEFERRAIADLEIHRYPARHGFFSAAHPEYFDRDAAELAWHRTLDFLARVHASA